MTQFDPEKAKQIWLERREHAKNLRDRKRSAEKQITYAEQRMAWAEARLDEAQRRLDAKVEAVKIRAGAEVDAAQRRLDAVTAELSRLRAVLDESEEDSAA